MKKLSQKWIDIAVNLGSIGVNQLAWNRKDALDLLQNIQEADIGILGGDLYVQEGDSISSTGDNWYCERIPDEDDQSYYARSKLESIQFINKKTDIEDENSLFVLVMTEQLI